MDVLGELVIRDFSGDIYDRDFREMVRYEARKRGAGGAWIVERRFQETESFRTETVDTTVGPGRGRVPTGHINKDVGIVHIILYNYTQNPPHS